MPVEQTTRSDSALQAAYNLGWHSARNRSDRRFHVPAPKQPRLADEYYQGFDDGRRSMLVGGR